MFDIEKVKPAIAKKNNQIRDVCSQLHDSIDVIAFSDDIWVGEKVLEELERFLFREMYRNKTLL